MPFDQRKARLRRRHHVRHELRVRLRLPPRQHGGLARRRRPARPPLRDRGRGRLDPDRRGAHAADHLGRADDRREDLLRLRARRRRRCSGAQSKGKKAEDEALAAASTTSSTTRSTRRSRPSESAIEKVERALKIDNLYDPRNVAARQPPDPGAEGRVALQARRRLRRSQDGEVKIVDEFTGRIMEGRRWSEGLHQAVEAKEGVAIQEEHQTLATITLQNYFRLYEKLAGMTGTAKTEEKEFVEIYNLDVVPIPTNVAGRARRQERPDLQDEGGEVRRRRRRHQGAPREGAAGARRHDRRRDLRVPLASCSSARASRTTS